MQPAGKSFRQSLLHLPVGMLNVLGGLLSIPLRLLEAYNEQYRFVNFLMSIPNVISYGLGQTIALVLKGAIQIVTSPLSLLFAVTTKPLASLIYKAVEYRAALGRFKNSDGKSMDDMKILIEKANTPGRIAEVISNLKEFRINIDVDTFENYFRQAVKSKHVEIALALYKMKRYISDPDMGKFFSLIAHADLPENELQSIQKLLIPYLADVIERCGVIFPDYSQFTDYKNGLKELFVNKVLPGTVDYNEVQFREQAGADIILDLLMGICESDTPAYVEQTHKRLWEVILKNEYLQSELFGKIEQKGDSWVGLDSMKTFVSDAAQHEHAASAQQQVFIQKLLSVGQSGPDMADSVAEATDSEQTWQQAFADAKQYRADKDLVKAAASFRSKLNDDQGDKPEDLSVDADLTAGEKKEEFRNSK